MDIPETDSEDEVPPGWEEDAQLMGLYFMFKLPYGWEREIHEDGKVVFVDHSTHKTTFTDPRLAFAVEETESSEDLRQRFDASSTGLHITHGRDLSGFIAVITGANSGIGFETARSLAYRGCTVIFACRNLQRAIESIAILKRDRPYANCRALNIELTSLKMVKQFAQEFKSEFGRCDILILNAGLFGVPFTKTEDSLEANFQVNFLSHFYLAILLQPLMTSSTLARIVFVSSESHRFGSLSSNNLSELCPNEDTYLPVVAYNNSKLCCVLGCFELHRRFADRGIRTFAVHPGNVVYTNLSRNWWMYRLLFALVRPFTKSLQQACASSVYCAVSPDVSNCSGMYVNNCVPCLPSEEALSPVISNKLWGLSVQLIEERLGKNAFFLD